MGKTSSSGFSSTCNAQGTVRSLRRSWPLTPLILAFGMLLTLARPAWALTVAELPTGTWNDLLTKYVQKNGGVDYQGLDKNFAVLEGFVKAHKDLDLKGADDGAKKAVYLNLYNATMILNLLKYARKEGISVASDKFLAIEINSIKVQGGNIWNGDMKVNLAGHDVNLDDIEHGLIRGQGKGPLEALKVKVLDPRIHAAANCAAMSCPRLRELAYRPETIDAMLDENIKEYMSSDSQFAKVGESKLKANQIVFWYYDDFEETGKKAGKGGAGGWLSEFIQPGTPDREWKIKHLKDNFNDRGKISLKLSSAFSFHYDWHVNDRRNRK